MEVLVTEKDTRMDEVLCALPIRNPFRHYRYADTQWLIKAVVLSLDAGAEMLRIHTGRPNKSASAGPGAYCLIGGCWGAALPRASFQFEELDRRDGYVVGFAY